MTLVADRYRLLTRLGQGGMGVVWRARDELLRRDVAVKELHVRIGVDGDFQARQVLREARAAARLRHPGVVAVHDVVVDNGRPLIVMELVEGPSLSDVIREEGPLTEQRVAEIGARVLAALSVAHEQGVVHRDVKPANILLDGDRVVLTDFGIAAMTSDTTLTEAVLGSPEYLAPERVNGEPATPATDLWSLGVTLCAALRGESPFQRADTQATLAAVLTFEPRPIPQAPRVWPVLSALLRKDPRERPSATAAGAELASAAGITMSFETTTRPVDADTTRIAARLSRWQPLAALVTAVALLAGGAVWLVVRSGGEVVAGSATGTGTSGSPTVSAPPGFTGHQGEGFTIVAPSEWWKDSSDQDIYWVADPDSPYTVLAHIEWWPDADPGGAPGVLTGFEDGEFTMDFISNYRRIRLDEATAPEGMSIAELESTYHVSVHGDEFDTHELMRAVVTNDERTYILTVAVQAESPVKAEEMWQANRDMLTTIMDSFHLAP